MIAKRFKRQKRFSGIIFPTSFFLLALLVVYFLVASNLKINRKRKELLSQIDYLKGEIESLEKQKAELSEGVLEGNSEEYVEEKLREDLLLQKPGENVVSIIEAKPVTEDKTEPEVEQEESFFDKILKFLRIK